MSKFPTYSRSAQTGDKGLRYVDDIVSKEYGWIFKRTHQEHDFGVDAHADVVTPANEVTGQVVAFQVKCGASYLKERNRFGIVYRGEEKHFNYLANYPIPVIIVICDDNTGVCYWVPFSPESTTPTGSGWKITVPFSNTVAGQKASILKLLPQAIDAKVEMEHYWAMNDMVSGMDYLFYIIDKETIVALDTTCVRSFFNRLKASKELASHCQGKVEIAFHGYENDPRELFEIQDVVNFVKTMYSVITEAFFFLRTSGDAFTLPILACCLSAGHVAKRNALPTGENMLLYDTELFIDNFLDPGYRGLNEMTAWLGYSKHENEVIGKRVLSLFNGEGVEHGA